MKLTIVLLTFIISAYIFPACYVLHHSHSHVHQVNESCETCLDIFSIVTTISKIIKFLSQYTSTIIYLAILFSCFSKKIKTIFYININPTTLKVKLIN